MANPIEFHNYMTQLSRYTWIQLVNETQRLTNDKNILVEIGQIWDRQWELNREDLSTTLQDLQIEADRQEDRISHMDYLANTNSVQFVIDHRNYFLTLRQIEEIEEQLERLRRDVRREKRRVQNQLNHLALLASLVGLASLHKAERGDRI